jgi:hypothetical protein
MRIFSFNISKHQTNSGKTVSGACSSFSYDAGNTKLMSLFSNCLLIGGLDGETLILSVDAGTSDTIVATEGVASALGLSGLCKNLAVEGTWSSGGETLRLGFLEDGAETGSVTILVSEGSPLETLPFTCIARRSIAA